LRTLERINRNGYWLGENLSLINFFYCGIILREFGAIEMSTDFSAIMRRAMRRLGRVGGAKRPSGRNNDLRAAHNT
jgi:hypothetical protein